jgi:hypothetical protein
LRIIVSVIRERKAYIILVLICIFLCGGTFVLGVKNQEAAERRWCGMLAIEKIYAPPKPADPEKYPQMERVWLLHVARLKLFNQLGC